MHILKYKLKDNGIFPNSELPVLVYREAIKIPLLFRAAHVKKLFKKHHWSNNWRAGIYTYQHYHSNTHEVMAVIKGETRLQLGGARGMRIRIREGDVIVIPAGVAHCNLGNEKDVICVGGYPGGKDFDIKLGEKKERPAADKRIAKLKIPRFDPVTGEAEPLNKYWIKD